MLGGAGFCQDPGINGALEIAIRGHMPLTADALALGGQWDFLSFGSPDLLSPSLCVPQNMFPEILVPLQDSWSEGNKTLLP